MNAKPDRDEEPMPDKSDASKKPAAKAEDKGKSGGDSVSRVLKTVYDDTLRESIPDEFRDLLSKLD
ncbi:NepR family anti-sigma factor [Sphingomicrobium sp. XHP0239]|uniref:NepR family anti-sigma factor n=1 Tax=Sphingomicrobium maritimum TaxID=3133972 RepID=UPI0031CC8979